VRHLWREFVFSLVFAVPVFLLATGSPTASRPSAGGAHGPRRQLVSPRGDLQLTKPSD